MTKPHKAPRVPLVDITKINDWVVKISASPNASLHAKCSTMHSAGLKVEEIREVLYQTGDNVTGREVTKCIADVAYARKMLDHEEVKRKYAIA